MVMLTIVAYNAHVSVCVSSKLSYLDPLEMIFIQRSGERLKIHSMLPAGFSAKLKKHASFAQHRI